VVAERHDVGARCEQLLRELGRDPGAVGGVLAVDDAKVGGELCAQARQVPLDGGAAGDAEDVREEEESQFRTRDAAGRSSTDT
jgi:hypothetical protein